MAPGIAVSQNKILKSPLDRRQNPLLKGISPLSHLNKLTRVQRLCLECFAKLSGFQKKLYNVFMYVFPDKMSLELIDCREKVCWCRLLSHLPQIQLSSLAASCTILNGNVTTDESA